MEDKIPEGWQVMPVVSMSLEEAKAKYPTHAEHLASLEEKPVDSPEVAVAVPVADAAPRQKPLRTGDMLMIVTPTGIHKRLYRLVGVKNKGKFLTLRDVTEDVG